jgi:F-type H+-transporting ATPase subunit alpha
VDEDTRQRITHGRRIRACLKQPEFAPVSMPAQIAILLALTAGLFDAVPLARMPEAERAVQEAATAIPADVIERLVSADALSEADRQTIVAIGRTALAGFQPPPDPKPNRAGSADGQQRNSG